MSIKINRNNLFAGILLFLLIINLLLWLDLQVFYIRAILAFLFIILVPGALIMLVLKIRGINHWEYLVYTIGLSIAFIMFAGLAVNWGLPALGITDKPLALAPILVCFDIFLLIFLGIAFYRNKDLKYEIKFPHLDTTNNIFFIIPMIFPILSVLGAFILNNGGPNYLTMIMLGGIATYVLTVVIFRKKLNENLYPWAIFFIGLSLLLMNSFRSWYISGWDINVEYQVFRLTSENGLWDIANLNHAYNAMLSITVFPSIMDIHLGIGGEYIFKFIFQIIFALMPVVIYLIFKKYVKSEIAFLAVFIFQSQILFYALSSWARQEIAFLFISLFLLSILQKEMQRTANLGMIIILGISIVVSHYSTTYILLGILFVVIITLGIYRVRPKRSAESRIVGRLSWIFVILLILFSFFWYSQLTVTSVGLLEFSKNSFNNLDRMFSQDIQAERSSILDQLNIFYKPREISALIGTYSKNMTSIYRNLSNFNLYSDKEVKNYYPYLVESKSLDYRVSPIILKIVSLLNEVLKNIIRVLIVIGSLIMLFYSKERRKYPLELIAFIFASLALLILSTLIPLVTVNYNMARIYQQALIVLALPGALGVFYLLSSALLKSKVYICITLVLVLSFLFTSGFIFQLTGGAYAEGHLNNYGEVYDASYAHKPEIKAIKWLSITHDPKSFLYSDTSMHYKVDAYGNIKMKIIEDVLPQTIDRRAYVLSGYTNTKIGKGFLHSKRHFGKETAGYNFPLSFLREIKSTMYNNGESQVFK